MARQECDYYGGEIYSTNEQVVGTWIDGKPIYRRTYNLGSNLNLAGDTWTATNILKSGMAKVINAFGVSSNGTYVVIDASLELTGNYVNILNPRSSTTNVLYVTLEYTKS